MRTNELGDIPYKRESTSSRRVIERLGVDAEAAAGGGGRHTVRGGLIPLVLFLFAGLAGPRPAAAQDTDLLRTWQRAFVVMPGEAGLVRGWVEDIDERLPESPPPLPTVIYLHGCAGLGRISHDAAKLLAEAGYAVIMPDSFARQHKPKSCDPARVVGGLHRGVLNWRQAEANQAIREARRLAWVDPENVFLWGFSEGGNTTATLTGEPVNARVVEGWTCHAGWGEYRGLNAPPAEPVLALVGAEDPWFRPAFLQGDCGAFMHGRENSKSIVYERPHFLATKHHLSWHPEVQQLILEFLIRHRSASGKRPGSNGALDPGKSGNWRSGHRAAPPDQPGLLEPHGSSQLSHVCESGFLRADTRLRRVHGARQARAGLGCRACLVSPRRSLVSRPT